MCFIEFITNLGLVRDVAYIINFGLGPIPEVGDFFSAENPEIGSKLDNFTAPKMNFENVPKNTRSVIFSDEDMAFQFLLHIGLMDGRSAETAMGT